MFFQKPFTWLLTGLAATTAFQVSAQKKQDQFLISIYSPPPAEYVNDEQFKLMKEGNVDIIFSIGGSVSNNKAGNLKMLDMAQKHGLKVYAHDARINESDDARKAMVNDYKNHPALTGYYITDEPDSARLQSAVETMLKVKKLDPARDAYINHLPDWAVNNYENDFLKRYIEYAGKENINYLAYDNYPYKRKAKLEKTYFNNLDIIRRTGLKYGIKTSSCLQSFGMYFSGVEELRKPNPDEMRMNVFSNLAYGVKNPVWFPYWSTLQHGTGITFSTSIVDSTGGKTDLYESFKMLNGQMKQLGKTLIHLDAQEVYHTGDSLWIGTTLPPKDFPAQIADKKTEAIISRFTDKTTGQMYLMIVNRSFKKSNEITISLHDSVKKMKEISKESGKPVKSRFDSKKHSITENFLPGEGRLYAVSK